MTTIKDVARLAGVSVATVSRVMNKNGYVGKETEKKVLESMQVLNYQPNKIARALTNKATDSIALISSDMTNPFFPELVKSVENTAYDNGYNLILINIRGDGNKIENYYQEVLVNRYVDGIIYSSGDIPESDILHLQSLGIPCIALDRSADSKKVVSISINNYEGGSMAVEHLISIGCKKIAHLTGPMNINTSIDRYRAYINTIQRLLPLHPPLVIEGDFTLESGIESTYRLLERYPDVDGIFAANDLMAVGALKTLVRLGKSIPDEIALIGFDGIKLGTAVEPEISTIAQPISEIGSLAVKKLISLIKRPSHHEQSETLKVQLIQRTSTKKIN